MKQRVVFFEWPSCAGKSTAVDTLFRKVRNTFRINKDTIKRLISDYSHSNEKHHEMLEQVLKNMCETALNNWMSLFIESQKQLTNHILEYSKNKDISFFYINIEAPLDILKERFEEKRKNLEKRWIIVSYWYDDLLLDIFHKYHENKFLNWITIDTSKLDEKQVISEIEKYLEI